jgi:glycosyltransferase involved in cell wall biosynthesis
MRILVAHDVPRDHVGGMNRLMRFTHEWIATQGHEVVYFSSEDVPRGGRFWRRFLFPWAVYRAARTAFRGGKPFDIVNVHEPQSAAVALLKFAVGNPKIVVISHGSEHRYWELMRQEARLGRSAPSRISQALNPTTRLWQCKLGLTRADHVLCLNEEDRGYFNERLGIPTERITRIGPGAADLYRRSQAERLTRPVRQIVFLASWHKNKGIEDLVPAFVALAKRHSEIILAIVGAGMASARVKSDFPFEFRERIQAVQTTGDEENARILERSDIFVLPSLFEGTPLSLMEAMASALPIVTTNTCGMRDVIRHNENGFLVPLRSPERLVEAVETFIRNPALRVRLASAAQKDAAHYTWPCAAQTILSAYESITRRCSERTSATIVSAL